ncbi:unnamed protein product, partial [Prorocentrum cordatum]
MPWGPGKSGLTDSRGGCGAPSPVRPLAEYPESHELLFNVAFCACRGCGGARAGQGVGLGVEELPDAVLPRGPNVSEARPPIIAADLWPEMRSMKQQGLCDASTCILISHC